MDIKDCEVKSLPGEQWRDMKVFPGLKVSSLGRVIGIKGNLLKLGSNKGYPCLNRKVGNKRVYQAIHRAVYEAFVGPCHGRDIDHINRDPSDNRVENLRLATDSQNQANAKSRRNGHKGVTLDKRTGRWESRIIVYGKFKHLGTFNTEVEAARAYDVAAIDQFGSFAHTNFPAEEYTKDTWLADFTRRWSRTAYSENKNIARSVMLRELVQQVAKSSQPLSEEVVAAAQFVTSAVCSNHAGSEI